jgi:hypothetical protein
MTKSDFWHLTQNYKSEVEHLSVRFSRFVSGTPPVASTVRLIIGHPKWDGVRAG